MATTMRAKMVISSIVKHPGADVLKLMGVAAKAYDADGLDEDNTFAKFTPQASMDLTIANPALIGKFEPGETYYLDFTPVG